METELLEKTTESYCSNCAAVIGHEEPFCQNCGVSLDRPSWSSFSNKLAHGYKSIQERLTQVTKLPTSPKTNPPKLPPYAPAIGVMLACAIGIPYGVHLIDISYDVMSEDFIYQNAEKTLKANNPAMAAELLLRLNMDRPGKLNGNTMTLLGKTLMMRIDTEIQAKDWTSAMKDLKQMPQECPQYQAALTTIRRLEQNGTTTTQAAFPGAMPGMPAAQPVAAAVSPAQAAAATQTAAAATGNTGSTNSSAATTAQAPQPTQAIPPASTIQASAQMAQPAAISASQSNPAQQLKSIQGTGILQKVVANAMGAPVQKEKSSLQAPQPVTLNLAAQQNSSQPAQASQQPPPPVAPPTVAAVQQQQIAAAPATAQPSQPAETQGLIQPGVPIWQSFSHGGKTPVQKREAKKKSANPNTVAARDANANGKEIVNEPASISTSSKTPAGQKSQAGEGPKSYNPSDISRYNELLADYFRQHGSASKKSSDNQGTTSEPPSFQEWVSKGKPGFR